MRQVARGRGWRQAGDQPRRRVSQFGLGDGLDPNNGLSTHERDRTLEDGRVADYERPGEVVQPLIEPAANDYLGTDARDVAHRQADQRTLRWLVHGGSRL